MITFLCYDKEKIADEATNFYTSLFEEQFLSRPTFSNLEVPAIFVMDSISLEKPFTEEEVKSIVFHFGANKSPGPDEFTMDFLKVLGILLGMI